ncbi:FIST C-terminal domain-containing protein [bacterium]|nr:FIST C-terminal domain-containing protein [bacterium]
MKKLGQTPGCGLIFASARHQLPEVLEEAARLLGSVPLIACHTAGEYTEAGLTRGGLVVLLLASAHLICTSHFAEDVADVELAAQQLSEGFTRQSQAARSLGLGLSTTLLLVDSMAGTGEQLLQALQRHTRMFQSILGGAAGDDGAFQAPWVGSDQGSGPGAASALQFFHQSPWGVGIGHGLKPQTPPMKVTRAAGNVLYELDGRPAFEAYQNYAATRGINLTSDDTRFLMENELGVMVLNQVHRARAPVGVGPEGEIKLVAQVPTGGSVCILHGEPDAMTEACRQAAEAAKEGLGGAKAAAVIVFDCVCRGAILGDAFDQEITALRTVFPETPICGFLTYGEIARTGGRLDGWHNTTCVVVAIPARSDGGTHK